MSKRGNLLVEEKAKLLKADYETVSLTGV